ncbi:MAG: N-acetyltransferase [Chloroflexi bacterium]|nr:N-acetyltransferase [Chloroflexota bacterium]
MLRDGVPALVHVLVRPERPGDRGDVEAARAVELAAFPTDAEAQLLDALRAAGACDPARSLLAEVEGAIVGHCLVTATTLERPDGSRVPGRVLAIGPIGVVPALQGRRIGTRLMDAALALCEREGAAAVVLVGNPTYYARFGFAPARAQGLLPPGHWRDEVWLARRLPASRPDDVGVVHYARPFLEME